MIRGTRRLSAHRRMHAPHHNTHGRSDGISFIAVSTQEVGRYVSTPRRPSPLHAGTRRNLVPVGGQVFSVLRTRHDLFHPAFSATVSYRSHHHYSVAKIVCRRDRFREPRPMAYRKNLPLSRLRFGAAPQNKEYLCVILGAFPLLHLLFRHRKNDSLTSKNNRNEKDREQFRSNRIRRKRR